MSALQVQTDSSASSCLQEMDRLWKLSEAFGSSMAGDVIAEALILKSGSFEISVIGGRVNLHPLIIPGQIRAIC